MIKRKIFMKLGGGLGNQLFQYSAALSLGLKTQRKIVFDITNLRVAHHGSKALITHLDLPGDFRTSKLLSYYLTLIRRLAVKFPLINDYRGVYVADTLGFVDLDQIDVEHLHVLEGFFLSRRYVMSLRQQLVLETLEPVHPSPWFLELLDIVKNKKICAIHIRQGDYLKAWKQYGVLSAEYYSRAIEVISESYIPEEFWIFTDSPIQADAIFSKLGLTNYRVLSPPPNSPDAESLVLMSRSGALITANSTFSLWSAYFSESTNILVPESLYRVQTFENDLYLDSWTKIESRWMDLSE